MSSIDHNPLQFINVAHLQLLRHPASTTRKGLPASGIHNDGSPVPSTSLRVNTSGMTKENSSMEVRGRDAVSGLPRMIELARREIAEAINPVLLQIIQTVKSVLEETPPELAADIIDKGIVMAGGTSTLQNLDKLMTRMTGVVCHVAEDALLCVVRGTGVAIENIELYKRSVSRK